MGSRQRFVMSLSLPPDLAKEYRSMAEQEGKTISGLFREIFSFYRQERLKKECRALQQYGAARAKKLKISEKEIERLIFEGR